MHVAINGWFWNQPWTGSGQYVRNLVHELCRLSDAPQLSLVIPAHVSSVDDVPNGVNVIKASAGRGGNWGKLRFEQRTFPAAARKANADIAHVPYWAPPLSTKPARLVTSILDLIPLVLPAYTGGFRGALYNSLVSAAADGSAHILTLSEASKQDIITRLEIQAERITVTYPGVDERFHPVMGAEHDEVVRQKYNLPDEFVLYFGSFDMRKNVNTLLLAWTYAGPSLGADVPLVLAGRQPKSWTVPLFPDLKNYAKELEIEDYVIWTGEIDEADKPSLYRLARAVVFPSTYEGFGLPVLEAMASGTPVIAGNQSSIPEVAGDAAYLVDPTDARTMGAAIIAVVIQDDLHDNLSNQGRGQSTNFMWRKTAQQTLEVYRQVMAQ